MNNARAAEQSFTDMCLLVTKLAGHQKQPLTDFAVLYDAGFPGFNWYSRLILGKFGEEQLAVIPSLLESSPLPLVSFTTENVPEQLPEILKKNGYEHMVTQTGMVLELPRQLGGSDPHIIRIHAEDITDWSAAVTRAFEKPNDHDAFRLMIERQDCWFYAWMENGEMIGTTLLYTSHGNAGIHEVGVCKEFRRRGIARSLVTHALRQAVSDGASLSTLQASPDGRPVYAGMGYTEVSTIQSWVCPRKIGR